MIHLSKIEWIALLIALFAGIHFFSNHEIAKDENQMDIQESAVTLDHAKTPVIVAFGDSLTAGDGAPEGKSYPAQLSKLLGINVINEGVSGESAQEGLRRLPGVLKIYHPDIVILCEGEDDMLRIKKRSMIKTDLKQMIAMVRKAGGKVILLGATDPEQNLILLDAGFYKDIANETGVFYIPRLFSDVLSHADLVSGGDDSNAHPNTKGYAKIASKINDAIRENFL